MDIEILKKVIETQRVEMEKLLGNGNILKRHGMEKAMKCISHPNALAVLGVRRCGKSVFSLMLAKESGLNACYVNFDDERLVGMRTDDLNKTLQAFHELYGDIELIILDEIQNIEAWELFVNRLRRTKRVIVTGSSSMMLSGELSTHLTGRYLDFKLFPLSFREVIGFKPNPLLTEDVAKARGLLGQYMEGSGFPEFLKFGQDIIPRIYEDIVAKDCIRRHDIREGRSFREMASFLISNYGKEFGYSSLSRISGIKSSHTVKNYVKYLEDAFLLIVLERFSPKLKQQFIAPKKAYNIDHGLCNFVSFHTSRDMGSLFENMVCIDLMREKGMRYGMEVYYWRGPLEREVDFIVKSGVKVEQLIQVCYDISSDKTRNREISAILEASREMECGNLLVITNDYESVEAHHGREIRFIPLWKWLLRQLPLQPG